MTTPMIHYRQSIKGRSVCGRGIRTTTDKQKVACGHCIFIMLTIEEIMPTDPRVTPRQRERAGY